MPDRRMVPLTGSHRALPPGARRAGPIPDDEQLTVTVLVRRRPGAEADDDGWDDRPLAARPHLSLDEFAAARGADPADVEAVAELARQRGLRVVRTDLASRTVLLAGTAGRFREAFGVDLGRYVGTDARSFRGREGPVLVPAELAPVIEGVFGLDDRPQATPHFRPAADYGAVQAGAAVAGFSVPELARLYEFPSGLTGAGQTIAIIELGGGYRQQDLQTYFAGVGLPVPTVTAVSVDGARNAPIGQPDSADGEVLLDIEVAGAAAPGVAIAVYFAPNSDQGFLHAIQQATHDRTYLPSIISISWGLAESGWTAQSLRGYDQTFADAAALGITVCCASGDNGSADRVEDGLAHVDFPASSPHVLACGGTRLDAGGSSRQEPGGHPVPSERAWNDGQGGATGGGVSDAFDPPVWQRSAGVPASVNPGRRVGRGVPDVAGDADPATGYQIVVDGQHAVFGGTSAVSPLWAALVARFNESTGGRAGLLNSLLHSRAAGTDALRDVTEGNNGVPGVPGYPAYAAWDACTGLGTPDGARLLAVLT
jgi:kumamolisin